MLRPANDLQFPEHPSPERVPRQHAFDSALQHPFRRSRQQMFQGLRFQVADIACIPVIDLVFQFGAGDPTPLGINHDAIIARIGVRRLFWLVLPAQQLGNLGCNATQRHSVSVDHVPLPLDVAGSRRERLLQLGFHQKPSGGMKPPPAIGGGPECYRFPELKANVVRFRDVRPARRQDGHSPRLLRGSV